MADDREKLSDGPNDRPRNESIAGTTEGIPDEAVGPGQELPEPPSDQEVERIAKTLGVDLSEGDPRSVDEE